jgi:hypothetical protein
MKTIRPALRNGCLILANMALLTSPVLAQNAEVSGKTASATTAIATSGNAAASVISSVAITQAPERAAVRVDGEGRLEVKAARLQSPDRLVLDFAGTRLHVDKTLIPGVSAPVRGVRLGQFRPDVARIVVDLTTATPFQIAHDGSAIVIYFEAQATAPATTSVKTATTNATVVETKSEVAARPQFHYAPAGPRTSAPRTTKKLQIAAPHFTLPNELTQPTAVLASFGGVGEPARPATDASAQQSAAQAISKRIRRYRHWRHSPARP